MPGHHRHHTNNQNDGHHRHAARGEGCRQRMSCHPQRFDPGPDDLSSPFCGLLRYLCRPARSLYSLCGPFADTIGPGRLLPEGLGGFRRWSRARLLPCGIFEVMLLPPFLLPFYRCPFFLGLHLPCRRRGRCAVCPAGRNPVLGCGGFLLRLGRLLPGLSGGTFHRPFAAAKDRPRRRTSCGSHIVNQPFFQSGSLLILPTLCRIFPYPLASIFACPQDAPHGLAWNGCHFRFRRILSRRVFLLRHCLFLFCPASQGN